MNTSAVNTVAQKTRPQNKALISKAAPVPAFSNSNLFFQNEAAEWVARHPFIQSLALPKFEEITADLAKHILAHFNSKNRRIKKGKKSKFNFNWDMLKQYKK